MPYIKQSERPRIDEALQPLLQIAPALSAGELNYCITRLVLAVAKAAPGYAAFNGLMGVLACVQAEFYRRVVAPYEQEKIAANGDVLP